MEKDSIKEILFDHLGVKDREWSKQIGRVSYKILYSLMEKLLEASQSFIVESNFNPKFDNETFQTFQQKYGVNIIQILCKTEGNILFERFKERSASSERHPGHVDHQNHEEFKPHLLQGRAEPLEVESTLFEIDTTDFSHIDLNEIIVFYAANKK